MTRCTVTRELTSRVIGILHAVEIWLVTLPAIGVREIVIPVDVACLTGFGEMGTLQWELRRGVIEGRGFPCDAVMTLRAVVIELRRRVIGLYNRGEITLVALPAISVRDTVIAVDVAGLAGFGKVRALQREFGRRVIKGRRLPGDAVMALRAVVIELRGGMIGLQCGGEITLVTLPTVRVAQLIVSVDVAGLAGFGKVRTLQREFGRRVIKGRRLPGDAVMALRAVVIELRGGMIGLQCGGEITLVTLPTVRVAQLIVSVDVAGLAGFGKVRTLQREFGRRVIEGRGFPGRAVMALRAVVIELRCGVIGLQCGGEIAFVTLPAVRVGQLIVPVDVASLAGLGKVRALQRELGRCVIEGRRFPGRAVMALRAIVIELRCGVIGLQCGGEIALVTLPAVRVGQLIVSVDVASLAGLGKVRALQREFGRRVIEGRGFPGDAVMALRAVVIELRGGMIGLQCGCEIALVTLPAVRVGQLIVSVDVAGLAGFGKVRALQREFGRRVIKGRRLPGDAVMALRAVVIELRGGMIGLLRCGKVAFVALPAVSIADIVISVDVAGLTGLGKVRALQRELRRRMIEGRGLPGRATMALRAVMIKLRGGMIGLLRCGKIALVALPAIGIGDIVVAVDVAGLAWFGPMRTLQRKHGRRMIEGRGLPGDDVVTFRAIVVKLRGCVIRLSSGGKISLVTLPAVGVIDVVVAIDVARLTRLGKVRTLQREFGRRMIEGRGFPCDDSVTLRAIMIELRSGVIGLLRGGKIRFVTLPTIGIGDVVIAVDVARLTRLRHMRAFQRKFGRRMIEVRRTPAVHGVTCKTILSECSGDMIGIRRGLEIRFMAHPALCRGTGEHQTRVTICAQRLTMTPEQREARLVMIDIHRHAVERLPRLCVVTVLALQGESDEDMVRLCGPVEILGVAALAFQRQACVLASDMAFLTFSSSVRSGQSEIRQIMIESRGTPRLHIVTTFAVLGKLSANVIGEAHRFVVGFVTSPAFLRELGEAGGVTCVTGRRRMRAA